MTYGVQLPDGRTIGFDESTPLETAQQIVRRDFPEAFQKKSGVGAEFKEGLASLLGSTKTALTAPFDAKGVAKQSLLEEQARGAEFESGVSLDKLKKAYADYGLLGGAGEAFRQVPLAVSGQLPQLGASLGAARLGAMAGSAIMPGVGTVIGGGLGALGASFAPQAGQFITRQAEEQQRAGQEIDPSLAKAYGAAVPAAAIDVAANYFTLGKGLVGKILGRSEEQIAAGVAKNAAKYEADLVRAAEAKLIPTVAKGAARGLTEIPGEVAQQILERAQAGLPLFTEDAIKEYGESAYQAALVGPAFGAIASPIDRAGARSELDTMRAGQRAAQRKEELAKETEYKASPEYVADLTGRRDKLQEEMSLLEPILKAKPTTDEEKQLKREASARMRDYKIEMQDIVSQLREAAPETKGLPETLEQRIWRERIAKQTAPIAQEREMVTDEFGNIVPGLKKEAATAGRELTPKEKSVADRAMLDLKKLQEAEAKRQLNEQEKAHKAFLQQQIDEIISTSDFAKQYVYARLDTGNEGYRVTGESAGRYTPEEGIPLDVSEPGFIRQKGLEQVLRAKGQTIKPEERKKFEQNIDSGYLTRDLKGVLGLGANKELGQTAHDLKVLEDAQEALPVLQERMRAFRDQNKEVLNKELFDKSGAPTIDYRRAIAAQTVYGELERLVNIAKDTISKNKDAQIVSQGLAEAKRKLPKEIDLVEKGLKPDDYQIIIDQQLDIQQRAYDNLRIALDDLADGEFIGSGVKPKVKYDKKGNLVGEDAKELKQKYDSLAPAYKNIYPTFESYYQEKASVAANTKETLIEKLQKAKQEYIEASLKQAAAYRLHKNLDPLTEGEVKDVAEKMDAELSDAIARGQLKPAEYKAVQEGKARPIYEEVLVPAQMRAGKIVRPAYTSRKLVGFEGLEQVDLFDAEQGYTSRDSALGSVGLDFGPRLPANLVKQMRGSGIGSKATGAPSERMTGFEGKALPGIVEHRGYVQDRLSSLKVGLMRVPQYTEKIGAGPKSKVVPEKRTLFLEKTKGEPVTNKEGKVVGYKETEKEESSIKRTMRILESAKSVGRSLENKRGMPRDVGRTFMRAADFISAQMQAGKDADTTQLDKILELVDEQLYRFKRGQDTTRKYIAETNDDLNALLDKYEAAEEGKQGELFMQSKKMANRQLAEIKSELDELGPVSDFKDLRERFDIKRRMKETEEWIAKFHGPSGMGRSVLASAIKTKPNLSGRPEYSQYATAQWWKQESENLAEAMAAFEKEQSDMELRMGYLEQYKDALRQLERLDADYRYASIPGFLLGKNLRTEDQEQRRNEYLTIRSKFTTLMKDILGILQTNTVVPTRESNYAVLIKDATAELEEVLKAKFAHHELILESLKTAPARYLHAYRMRKAAEAKLSEYKLRLAQLQSKEFVGKKPVKDEREEVLAAQKEAEKLFKYSDNTLKSIKEALDKDAVIKAVNKDPDVVWARQKLDMLLKKMGKPLKPTQALTEEGKRLRDERVAEEKNVAERIKTANDALAQIAKIDKELSKTTVSQKPLAFIQKERAANLAVITDEAVVDLISDKIVRLEAQQRAANAGVVPKDAKTTKAEKAAPIYKDMQSIVAELTAFTYKKNDKTGIVERVAVEVNKPIEIVVNADGTPKQLNKQQQKSLEKAKKDLDAAYKKLELAKSAQLQLAAAAMRYVETTIGKPTTEIEGDKQEAFMLLYGNLEKKRDQYQEAVYALNKEKAPKEIVDAVEKQKQAINNMMERLKKRGPNTEGLPSLENVKDAEDFISTMRARAEIKGALESAANTRISLQELEDINKVLEEQAKIADKLKNPDRARELRAEAKQNQSLIDAEKALISKGNNPEKAVRKHALRTGHNSNFKTAERTARGEIYASREGSKKQILTPLGQELKNKFGDKWDLERTNYIKRRTAEEFNRLSIAESKYSNDSDFDDTVMRVAAGESGGIDIAEANNYINNMLKKQGFNPTRRAVTGAMGAFMLPIKIPSIAGINADFKQMIARNAMSGLALPLASDITFNNNFSERYGSFWPDAMGDLEHRADKITGGVLSLIENTYNSLVTDSKNDSRFKDHDKAVDFHDAFNDKIYTALRKLYKPFAHKEWSGYANSQKDFNFIVDEMLNVDRGQLGNEWQSAHSALYVNDPTEYAALVTEAYTSALRAVGVNPQKAVEQIEESKAKVVTLASGVKFLYAETASQAPTEFLLAVSRKGLDLDKVRGGVMPDGTVVVIGDTHNSIADLQETISHEILGHYAIDTLLGPDGMKALVKKAFSAGKEGVYKLAAELGVYDDVAQAAVAGKTAGMSENEINTLMIREMLAHVAERPLPSKLSQALKDFIKMVVAAVRNFFRSGGLDVSSELSTQEVFKIIREAKKQYDSGRLGAYKTIDGDVVFRDTRRFGSSVSQNSIDTFDKLYAKKKTLWDSILANVTGMSGRIQWFDNLAGFEHILGEAEKKGQLTSEDALNANYFMRLHGQRLNLTSQFATHGVSQLAKNEAGELDLIERPDAANLVNVSKILERAKALGSPKVVNQFFQTYLVAKRVKNVGLKALNVDLKITEQDLKNVINDVEAAKVTGIFEEAAAEYAKYNKALIDFAVKTGAIPKEEGARLTRNNDYVPFYRVKNGYAELVVAGEHAIMIGRLKDQPYLHELVGDKEMLVDFETSAFQNTGILVDLAMRNMATTTLMRTLEKAGGKDRIATRVNAAKALGPDIVRGKVDGYEAAWRINTKDTGFEDIPVELLVKGLEGIKTTLPVAVKAMGLPSRFLRTMITRTPTYVVNQIVKDSTAMWLYSGADIKPVLSATKELGTMLTGKNLTEKKLQASGIEGGQLFTGMPEDMGKIMLQIMGGKSTMQELFVKADRLAMKADAATRVAMYNAYVQKGMSPMRAKLAVLEALNFNKRGLSPTIHMLSTLVPFMNTQIQGLDVLAKAFRGKLTLGQQKDLRAKLWRRGTALGLFTIAYAALMSDDEAYKNADPWTKYTSWFIRVPFFDEPIKVPAPFEFGYVFKALPEAVYNIAFKDEKLSNVLKFYRQAAINSVPISVPQAIKPAIEAFTGTSFYTGQGIESAREKSMLPGFRERNNTTEVAKLVASIAPETLSPVMLDHLTRGYGGGLGIALASVLNPFLAPTSDVVAPEKTSSQLPLIGGFFQPNDAPGIINAAYEISNRAQQASKTFNDLVNSGQKEKATAFLNKFKNEIVMQEAAGSLVREMGELSAVERLIARGEVKLSASEKTAKLKEIRAAKIKLADAFAKGYEKVSERV